MRPPLVGGDGLACRAGIRENGVVMWLRGIRLVGTAGVLLGLLLVSCTQSREANTAINVGLIAPLSGYLAPSGEAIQRGMLLAMDEVNRQGGVLGRRLALVVSDVENDPSA